MSGESATGSANVELLGQCEEELKAIETAANVESVVAAMRGREGSAELQEMACWRICKRRVLQNLTTSSVQNEIRASNAGAIEAVVTAMSVHADCVLVQKTASAAIRNLTSGNVKCIARAGTSGAVETLVKAMRRHGKSPGVQSSACLALYFLIEDNAENKIRALHECAKGLAKAALKTHPNNKRVVHEARDLLTQFGSLNQSNVNA
jgi:hypothetical protein